MVALDRFERLRREHDELREDFGLLLSCLEKFETLLGGDARGISRIPALMHRERFGKTLKRFPLSDGGPSPTLADALQPELLRTVLEQCGGEFDEILALKEASSAIRTCLDAVQAEKAYIFGGAYGPYGNHFSTAESLDPRTGRWDPLPPMRLRRAGHVAAVLSGRVYVCGGIGEMARVVEEFIPKQREWDRTPPVRELNAPRYLPAAAIVDGRLYIVGGEDFATNTVHDTAESLDPRLPKGDRDCTLLPCAMHLRRRHLAAAILPGPEKLLLVHGGVSTPTSEDGTPAEGSAHGSHETLNLSEPGSTWQFGPGPFPLKGHTMTALDKNLFLCGGQDDRFMAQSAVARLDVDTGAWSSPASMPAVRRFHAAVPMGGCLYLFGGLDTDERGSPSLRSGVCLNPSLGAWGPLPDMTQGRAAPAAVVVKVKALAVRPPRVQSRAD